MEVKATVVVCFDKNFEAAACVTLTSLYINNPFTNFETAILSTHDIHDEWVSKLSSTYNQKINCHKIDESRLSEYHEAHHISKATYLRFFIPEVVSEGVVLYLDCDTIVQCDVGPLLVQAAGKALVGVDDLHGTAEARIRLQLDKDEPYFNTGVLAFDVDLWKKLNLQSRIKDYYKHHYERLSWLDQCTINGALRGMKTRTSSSYNVLYQDLTQNHLKDSFFTGGVEGFRGIFHFNAAVKAWHLWCWSPYRNLYEKYRDLSLRAPETISKPRTRQELLHVAEYCERIRDYKSAVRIYKSLVARK